MVMYNLATLTTPHHDELIHKIYNANYFLHASYDQIAKPFLSHFIEGEIFSMPYTAIRAEVISQLKDSADIPEEEIKFFAYICKTFLYLEALPASVMLGYYRDANQDLQIIEKRIANYEKQTAEIEEKQPKEKTEEDTYKIRLLKHYIEANRSASEEILDFLFYRIEEYTKFNTTVKPGLTSLIYGGIPYSFRFISRQLQWESLSNLNNKFADLSIEKHRELEELYKSNKPVFYSETRSYIEEKKIIDQIRKMVSDNHRLDQRSRIFHEAFQAYETGSKYLFCSVIALQIEGLFADYCLELGIEETSIRGGSLTDKVRMVATKNNRYRNFEYYAFSFPLIRNQIAHGNLISEDVDNLADYLLLDLFDVCLSLTSLALPVNRVVSILRLWQETQNDKKLEVKYSLYREIVIPDFYNLKETEVQIREVIFNRPFWDYLHSLIHHDLSMLKKGIRKIVTTLRKLEINVKWCNEVLEKLMEVTPDGFDEYQFLEELNSI